MKRIAVFCIVYAVVCAAAVFVYQTMRWPRSNVTVLTTEKSALTSDWRRFQCSPPLTRTYGHAAILIELFDDWGESEPWVIKFADGRVVTVRVILVGDDGTRYEFKESPCQTYRRLTFNFDEMIPKDARIREVLISSSGRLECGEILWGDFETW